MINIGFGNLLVANATNNLPTGELTYDPVVSTIVVFGAYVLYDIIQKKKEEKGVKK